MFILFLFLLYVTVTNGKLIVKEASVSTLIRDNVGMIFYVTLENNDSSQYRIYLKMEKCCEQIAKDDRSCKFMQLLGGDMGVLQPKSIKNTTLLYPNMYLHNRKGKCLISIISLNEKNQVFAMKTTVLFDTTLNKTTIPRVLADYYTIDELEECESVDLDPLDDCQPVNCHMKYLGTRNYYNSALKRCQKVPQCIANENKDLPDVAYIPVSNACRDLENVVTKDELHFLQKGAVKGGHWYKTNTPPLASNFRCHHGVVDRESGFCICDAGWTSVPFHKKQYEPSLSLYHMCNVKTDEWKGGGLTKLKMTLIIISLTAAAGAVGILLISCLLRLLYSFVKACEFREYSRKSSSKTNTKMYMVNSLLNAEEGTAMDIHALAGLSMWTRTSRNGGMTNKETASIEFPSDSNT